MESQIREVARLVGECSLVLVTVVLLGIVRSVKWLFAPAFRLLYQTLEERGAINEDKVGVKHNYNFNAPVTIYGTAPTDLAGDFGIATVDEVGSVTQGIDVRLTQSVQFDHREP